MIQTICKEHDWVVVFTFLNKKKIDTNYQCRYCGIIKVEGGFKREGKPMEDKDIICPPMVANVKII